MVYKLAILSKENGEENRRRILEYFRSKPYAHQRECATSLDISLSTVHRHLKEMRKADEED